MLIAGSIVLLPLADLPLQIAAGVRPLLLTLGVGALLTAVWVRLLGRGRGGAAAAISLMALVGASGALQALPFVAALAIIAIERAWTARGTMRLRIPWGRITSALNLVLIVFVGLQLGRAFLVRQEMTPLPVPPEWTASEDAPRPDVFLILADGHGRLDVLADRYGYNASDFSLALAEEGFVESPNSYANHSLTRYSLSVLLNGRPLSELGQDMAGPADEDVPFRALPRTSGVSMFASGGYETVVISAGFDHLPLREVDRYVDVGPRTELEEALWGTSAIGKVVDGLTDGFAVDTRSRILAEVQELKDIVHRRSSRPQFVLAHLPSPHWPMVLNADCSLRPSDGYTYGTVGRGNRTGDAKAVQIVADQTRCVDTLLVQTVREIVEARPDAVVVVFSDHGPEERIDLTAPDDAGIRDKLANLFWARTPGSPGLFPRDVTLVNVLPLIANAYLGTDLPFHANDVFLGPTPASDKFLPYQPPE